MPEGDTIATLARVLRRELVGKSVAIDLPLERRQLEAANVLAVRAHGKHLFIDLSDGHTLQTHLGMDGTWHRADASPSGRGDAQLSGADFPSRTGARAILRTDGASFVCINPKEIRVLRPTGDVLRRRTQSRRLGPDLIAGPDLDMILARIHGIATPDTLLIDLLLDQRVASGIGNVFKCELMFIKRWPITRTAGTCSTEELRDVYAQAADWLQANVRPGRRATRAAGPVRSRSADAQVLTQNKGLEERVWVYGRKGEPCFVCGTPVKSQLAGARPRRTYWCPVCQRDQ